jgi:hypothetical protein
VVRRILAATNSQLERLIGDAAALRQLQPEAFTDAVFGVPTVTDILRELEKPGRDPRPVFKTVSFREGVEELEDLRPGMVLEGVVTNVAAFGAFVDVGVHQDGLVHISAMANAYVKDPRTIAKGWRCRPCQSVGRRPETPADLVDNAARSDAGSAADHSTRRDRLGWIGETSPTRRDGVRARAIPGPSAATGWPRHFGERG